MQNSSPSIQFWERTFYCCGHIYTSRSCNCMDAHHSKQGSWKWSLCPLNSIGLWALQTAAAHWLQAALASFVQPGAMKLLSLLGDYSFSGPLFPYLFFLFFPFLGILTFLIKHLIPLLANRLCNSTFLKVIKMPHTMFNTNELVYRFWSY